MRSHFLRDLMIHGREAILAALPDFDFYNLRRVTGLNWNGGPNTPTGRTAAEFALIALYDGAQRGSVSAIRVRCSEVKQF
jgi:hypothetical protein